MLKIEAAILAYLEAQPGHIRRKMLHDYLLRQGFIVTDSTMRGIIQRMKDRGEDIGSTHGKHPGYYIVRTYDEAMLAIKEYEQKLFSMQKTIRCMKKRAQVKFGISQKQRITEERYGQQRMFEEQTA